MLFAADIEKAFDSLEHNFLFATLEKIWLCSDFIKWIKVLFFDVKNYVMNNGFSTGYFNFCRGTKQGDPLYPYLFILTLEVFFIQVRDDKSIRGFKMGDPVCCFTNQRLLLYWSAHVTVLVSAYYCTGQMYFHLLFRNFDLSQFIYILLI